MWRPPLPPGLTWFLTRPEIRPRCAATYPYRPVRAGLFRGSQWGVRDAGHPNERSVTLGDLGSRDANVVDADVAYPTDSGCWPRRRGQGAVVRVRICDVAEVQSAGGATQAANAFSLLGLRTNAAKPQKS